MVKNKRRDMNLFNDTYTFLDKNINLIIVEPDKVKTCRTPGGPLDHSFNNEAVEARLYLRECYIDTGARCAMARAIADLYELIETCIRLDVDYIVGRTDTLDGKYLETAREARRQIMLVRTMSEVRAS